MKNCLKKVFGFWLVLFFSASLMAQTGVGKLSGTVVDADTKEPLIGANIIIMNTNLGAATNVDGEYYILNIPPGTYQVKASYVGYADKIFQEVRIVAGITYELNIELTTDFTLPDIVVQDKKFFEEKSTNTTKVYDADDIEKLPVRGVQNVASLNAGVVKTDGSGGETGNATINVRGGRGGEVLYIIDGVPQNDPYSGGNYGQVPSAAIEQISFQIGGFEAKYGQVQSGVINVTTKSGSPKYRVYADVVTSSFTDPYESNSYTANLSGPILPGNDNHTFFISGERGWYLDHAPSAMSVEIPSVGISSETMPFHDGGVWRGVLRTSHSLGDFTLRLGANMNIRKVRGYVHTYAKYNSYHNPVTEQENYAGSIKLSQNISSNAFWNINLGVRQHFDKQYDPVYGDDVFAYGDADDPRNAPYFQADGVRPIQEAGMWFLTGRPWNGWNKYKTQSVNLDFDFTSQIGSHLFEFGGGGSFSIVRQYNLAPVTLATLINDNTELESYEALRPFRFGYDVTGKNETESGTQYAPKYPIFANAYVQDRWELSDMVLNLGVRVDYFDTQADILKDPTNPYGFGDLTGFDNADFTKKEAQVYFSPRIGIGFPVTSSTVFHAQYGKFVQMPQLNQLYTSVPALEFLITDNNGGTLNTGHLDPEITTQYEIGFRQVIAEIAALNITAFYKNTEDLVNVVPLFFSRPGDEAIYYNAVTANTDFGTVKGLTFAVDVSRTSYFSVGVDYTLSIAEGTGSSVGSNFVAVFRNSNGEFPTVIAPLAFDQRHTGIVNLDFTIPKGELGAFEMFSANVLFRFNSGRPYTPITYQDPRNGATNVGESIGYVNSAYGPGNFRIDLKLEKSFSFGNFRVTPYVWIGNLLDADNPVTVWRATGDPYSSGYLDSPKGKVEQRENPNFASDFRAFENDPGRFGEPRTIKLGLRVDLSNISF